MPRTWYGARHFQTANTAGGLGERVRPLSRTETLVLTAIAYFQPVTRGELSALFGKEISRDAIGQLRASKFIAAGPRSPGPGAPYRMRSRRPGY
jgi:segregation and condensation protein B